jgi:MFS family permease
MWMFSWNIASVVATQLFAGAVWSGFSLAAGNFLFDSLPSERRASGTARLNLLAGIAILLGGLFGSAIVDLLPQQYVFLGVPVTFFTHLQVIMLISGLLRVGTIALFLGRFKEVRRVPHAGFVDVLLGSEGRPGDPSSL